MSTSQLVRLGGLLGNQTRATVLTLLLGGRALSGGELARRAGVAPSTVSGHLSALQDAGLVVVEAQGRHRYFRLADDQVAQMLELVGGSAGWSDPGPAPRAPAALTYARSCYDHLAGTVGVRLYDAMWDQGIVGIRDRVPVLTGHGEHALEQLGIDLATLTGSRRPLLRQCLDWTERRYHLAGAAGAALLETLLRRRWVVAGPRPRALKLTRAGHRGLHEHFGVDLRPDDGRTALGPANGRSYAADSG